MSAVLITGGASGIGRATAVALAETGQGVALWDLNREGMAETAALCHDLGVACSFSVVDVANSAQRVEALNEAVDVHGGIHGLVHAAGVTGPEPITTFTPENWDFVISINLTAAAALTYEVAPHLKLSEGGSIVYLSSVLGWFGHEWLPAYCTSKAGLLGLTRASSHELAKVGVRVNAVCPGYIETPMTEPLLAIPGLENNVVGTTPLGRLGQPRDIADVIVFLLSEKARFVTGASLVVDGGLTSISAI